MMADTFQLIIKLKINGEMKQFGSIHNEDFYPVPDRKGWHDMLDGTLDCIESFRRQEECQNQS